MPKAGPVGPALFLQPDRSFGMKRSFAAWQCRLFFLKGRSSVSRRIMKKKKVIGFY